MSDQVPLNGQDRRQISPDPGALSGLLVLDFGQAAVGPVSASYLGMLGATVIKVEQPTGDAVRRTIPQFRENTNGRLSTTFAGNNLTKRGIVLDLKSDEGHRNVLRLIAKADVLVENFRSPAVMERLGLGYHSVLAPLNPRLIYLQSSAFGPRGPWSGMYSDEWITEAICGFVTATGADGGLGEFTRGSAPLDWNGAMLNVVLCLAALMQRDRTGRGQMIEASQFGSSIFSGLTRIAEWAASRKVPKPLGSGTAWLVPDQAFRAADGWVHVCTPGEKFWTRLCDAIGAPELAKDARFAENAARVEHRAALVEALSGLFARRTVSQWLDLLRQADVPCGPEPDRGTMTQALLCHPQVRANEMFSRIDAPYGSILTQAPHWQFEKTPASISRPAPRLGEHTPQVLEAIDAWTSNSTGPVPSASTSGGGCLAGLRIVEFAGGVPGPLAGMMLAQLGATVVRVEGPGSDWMRDVGPRVEGEGASYRLLNDGKVILQCDLRTDAGRDLVREHLITADAVLVGFRESKLDRLGISLAQVRSLNPRAIWCHISGWGREGPLADAPVTELLVQALASATRYVGANGAEPVRLGYDLVSVSTGMAAVQGLLAALFWRRHSGEGQRVDVNMLSAGIAINQWANVAESMGEDAMCRQLHGPHWARDHGFACREGRCLLGFWDREKWRDFAVRIGRADLLENADFIRASDAHSGLVPPFVEETLRDWSLSDLERLVRDEMGGTVVPLLDIAAMLGHEQTQVLGMIDSNGGRVKVRMPFFASEGLFK